MPEEEVKQRLTDESEESIKGSDKQPERERERTQNKSVIRRIYEAMFREDEFKEETEEMRNRRHQNDEEQEENEPPVEKEQTQESDDSLPMNVKKNYEPSSDSPSSRRSSSRSVLMPVEEEALSEYINSSPPISVQSSVPSNRTIEYVDEGSPPQSVVSSRRSQETIEYIRSRSSRGSARSISI